MRPTRVGLEQTPISVRNYISWLEVKTMKQRQALQTIEKRCRDYQEIVGKSDAPLDDILLDITQLQYNVGR